MPKIRTRQPNSLWLRQRELGIKFPLGHADRFHKTLYSSIQPVTSWDHALSPATHGGVFNLEYSPDGSLLLAACERKTILMFDPLRRRLIHAIENAHTDCVNCVRFLDQRMFATCSDDSTVALWDARNLKQRIRTLHGHSNWVKNIEYSPKDSLLLTSGFDGSIYTWDINTFTENSILYTRVFHTNGLMRTRLSPDASKMLISTTSGYLIIIHNLKLRTLSQDLAGFRPNMYRLMQSSQTTIPNVASFTHLFSHSRTHNRVEFITDFPFGDDAEIISSLQVHPQGWCALSRNVSNGEKSEWTCIHDIQEGDVSGGSADQTKEGEETTSQFNDVIVDEFEDFPQPQPSRSGITPPFLIESPNRVRVVHTMSDVRSNSLGSSENAQATRSSRTGWQSTSRRTSRSQSRNSRSDRNATRASLSAVEVSSSSGSSDSRVSADRDDARQEDRDVYDASESESTHEEASVDPDRDLELDYRSPRPNSHLNYLRPRNIIDNFSTGNIELHVSTTDVWEAHVAIREARLRRERDWLSRSSNNTVVIIGDRTRVQNQNRQGQQTLYAIPRNRMIHQNTPRLTHYIEEPNVGSGYIKELCFSADGRLICSPFGYGVRLLAFSNDCSELSNCVPPIHESVQLHELATNVSHSGIVVSTKFSPRHCLLVSGCLSGKIVWHEPVV
ncbi:DDB1- and CUL4-associated factor 10 [Hylaeus anthracinus]|uniref:DDB1- and CUL4-associated factor 10 n=1 Tax=Hylaeus volcanicus TaxID=313075 RepID=UPI0023B7FADC|nr:DDB1- and CUL4-associated factor 10 [Hylaeus volcanicus]XP_054015734.1 DDB1- and CUL4-associated factor 10 [Hylaeus anthracinus]